MLLEYPSNTILNYRLFSVHRKIQYYTDDVNFRIDQKGFSSISYTTCIPSPAYTYIKTLVLEERQEEHELTLLAVNVLHFVYDTQLEELDIHYNWDEVSQFYGAKCPGLQYLSMRMGGNILG